MKSLLLFFVLSLLADYAPTVQTTTPETQSSETSSLIVPPVYMICDAYCQALCEDIDGQGNYFCYIGCMRAGCLS